MENLERKILDRLVLFERSRITLKALKNNQKQLNKHINSLKYFYKEINNDPDNDYTIMSLDAEIKYINKTVLKSPDTNKNENN